MSDTGAPEADALDVSHLRVSGQRLKVGQMGPTGARRAILVFSGIGMRMETAARFMAHLNGHFPDRRIVTLDVPGVGGSPTPALPYRMPWLSRLATHVLEKLGVDEVDVFGISWGGALAQQFAHDNRGVTRTLTLAATTAGMVMVPGRPTALLNMATPKRYKDPGYMVKAGAELSDGLLRADPRPLQGQVDKLSRLDQRGYLYQLLAAAGWTSWFWLRRVKCPTLIITGEDDAVVPRVNAEILAGRLTDVRVATVQSGHYLVKTIPAEIASIIEEFIDECDAKAPATP